jgi:hypothetical protein
MRRFAVLVLTGTFSLGLADRGIAGPFGLTMGMTPAEFTGKLEKTQSLGVYHTTEVPTPQNLSGKSFLALCKGDLEHGNANHVLGRPRQDLHILSQAPKMSQPRKGPFDNPAFRLHHKPLPQARRNMEDQRELLVHERHRRAPIPLVSTKCLHCGILRRRSLQHRTPSHRVGVVGRMDMDVKQIA